MSFICYWTSYINISISKGFYITCKKVENEHVKTFSKFSVFQWPLCILFSWKIFNYVFESCTITWSSFPPENIRELSFVIAKQKMLDKCWDTICSGWPCCNKVLPKFQRTTLLSSPPETIIHHQYKFFNNSRISWILPPSCWTTQP